MMPREKLLDTGAETLADEELLAIFLRTGLPDMNVLELAGHLLRNFNALRGLMQADQQTLLQCRGIGVAKYAELKAVLEMSERYLRAGIERGDAFSDPD